MLTDKKNIISQLRKEILLLEGFKPAHAEGNRISALKNIEAAFPNHTFPTGTIHEFVASGEQASACLGFMSGLLAALLDKEGICLWISTSRALFPSALKSLGIAADRFIFIDLNREREVLWATEEALKCEGLTAVVSELRELSFSQSRRLQLATEKSKVTGFILRKDSARISASTCTARWQVKTLPSSFPDDMPGVGFPRWQVELLKVRNGNPCSWTFEWMADHFILIPEKPSEEMETVAPRKAG